MSRRLGVVAAAGAAGIAVTPAQSYAPAAEITVQQQQAPEASPGQEPVDAAPQASSSPALAGPSVVEDVPAPALRAYQFAADVLSRTDASCGLDWSLLAAIGDVESDHGRDGNADLQTDGTSTPPILGPRLDGTGDVAAVPDTDDGSLDGDMRWDRAVGPMQFIPSTWAVVGSDADGDGARDPQDLDDAALSAAAYLCAGPGDLSTVEGQRAAVYRYNPSRAYVRLVLTLAAAYAEQTAGLTLPTAGPEETAVRLPTLSATVEGPAHPSTPPRENASATAPALIPADPATQRGSGPRSSSRQHAAAGRSAADPATPGGAGGGTSTGPRGGTTSGGTAPDGGSVGATTADPAPSTPPPTTGSHGTADGGTAAGGSTDGSTGGTTGGSGSTGGSTGSGTTDDGSGSSSPPPPLSGTLQRADDGTWSVAGTTVDFGDDAYLDSTALSDFDGADGVETNRGELETLDGLGVTVVLDEGTQVVLTLNDLAYR